MYYITIIILTQYFSSAENSAQNVREERSVVTRHQCHMAAIMGVFVDEGCEKLSTLYWLPNLHKRPY